MSEIGKFFFDGTIAAAVLPFLFRGFLVTLQLSALTILFGLALGLALDKGRAKALLRQRGIPTPEWRVLEPGEAVIPITSPLWPLYSWAMATYA